MEQLTSDSVLLIRRQDVVNRFRDWAPLNEFLKKSDKRWQTMNVLGLYDKNIEKQYMSKNGYLPLESF